MAERLFLHEAMQEVLAEHPAGLSARALADEIARRGSYLRHVDGLPPPPKQVSARASRYRNLFRAGDGRIRLK
jgi:hypothetical protein